MVSPILLVELAMFREFLDPLGEQGDLHFDRTGVFFMLAEFLLEIGFNLNVHGCPDLACFLDF
jgi:hypothetical protein